ncbi:hypothetical protein [Tenacibaculum finnmarkense]|uniref:hypothetical protein n=2 Tax=Tenacibaculum finnmarkense TaxID=2781243 RepID=UPI001E4F57CC|nr:hypothetical protein [Tenacibaculum finnmarkense]MCD8409680.1 hypothetical protein [Tenacibaculum finnmarkense genomovar ulcerans]
MFYSIFPNEKEKDKMTTKKDEILKAYENRTQNEITLYQISDYIDELYAPYVNVFKNHTDFTDYRKKNDTPRYVFTDERNKSIKSLKNKKGKLYVIFNASTDEKNKIKKFIEIENKHNKLVRVQILQRKLYTKETEYKGLEYFNKIEEEIKLLFEDVLELSKPTESNATKKEFQQENNKAEIILQEIWLPTAKITVKQFLEKGEKLGIWNSDLNLTQQRGAKLYGSGKTLLASLAGALKNYAIMESLDYKIIGKAFCKAFNIEEKKGVEEHYKAFNSYNDKYRKEFIRAFNIKL